MPESPSFKEIYASYGDQVYNLCLNYLQNEEDAEEVTQDVFVKVHTQIHKFKGKSSLKTWIYRISINLCLDLLKARKRKKRFGINIPILPSKAEVLPGNFRHPGVLLEEQEAVEGIFRAINQLPEKQKTALVLKSLEGQSQKEIAAIMEISVKAVESLLSRAKANLKKKLYPAKD